MIALADREDSQTGDIIEGQWRRKVSVHKVWSNNYTRTAEQVRSSYANYFTGPGAITWQWKKTGVSNLVLCGSATEEECDDPGDLDNVDGGNKTNCEDN